jgi:ribonuclease P protein component
MYYFNMLQKENRLKKRSAFAATYRTGKTFHSMGVTVFVGKEKKNESPTRVGFVVSKKIHKRAVKRNRIKRLMRESCRLLIKDGAFSDKYISLIFVASSKLLNKNFKEVDTAIRNLVAKL